MFERSRFSEGGLPWCHFSGSSGATERQGELFWTCRLVRVLFLLVVFLQKESFAQQQQYGNTEGYICTDAPQKSCSTFLLYRAQAGYDSVVSIANLFNANESEVARISKVTVDEKLDTGEAVFVPIHCICFNGSSIANISYIIQSGDTFYDLSVSNFESLAAWPAISAANNVNPLNLSIGSEVAIPVRCACPSVSQASEGTTALVTYPVAAKDDVGQIAADFSVTITAIETANGLDENSVINIESTLLIPIKTSRPIYVPPPPPPPGSPIASLPPSRAPTFPPSGKKTSNTGLYVAIGVAICAAILIFAVSALLFVALRRRKLRRLRGKDDAERSFMRGTATGDSPSPPDSIGLSSKRAVGDPLAAMSDLVGSDRPALFTFEELKDATNNFSDGSKVQGSVYRGILKGQVVAIKQMKGNMSQELRILCRVHHTNLVKLVGICVTDAEHLYLVYEYAENGSLSDCLHTDYLSKNKLGTKSSSYLNWTTRVQIALDAASGLEYIHDYVNPSYVHKDVKSSNILLGAGFRAKIANFAMAKLGVNNAVMTRHIAGTYGYMAPEYLAHGLVTTKADVFAFGVVLLELLSGQEAISEDSRGEERCLYASIRPVLEGPDPAATLRSWIDPVLETNFPMDTAMSVASLAKLCVEPDPNLRPSMKDITYTLSNLVNASMEWETSSVFANTLAETPIEAR